MCIHNHIFAFAFQEKRVMEKVYGKQKVYVVNQELFPKVEEAEIKGMDVK